MEEYQPQCIVIFYDNKTLKTSKILKEYSDKFIQIDFRYSEIPIKSNLRKYTKTDKSTLYDLDTRLSSIFDIDLSIDMPSSFTSKDPRRELLTSKLIEDANRFEEDMFNALPLNNKDKQTLYIDLCKEKKVKPLKPKEFTGKTSNLSTKWMKVI